MEEMGLSDTFLSASAAFSHDAGAGNGVGGFQDCWSWALDFVKANVNADVAGKGRFNCSSSRAQCHCRTCAVCQSLRVLNLDPVDSRGSDYDRLKEMMSRRSTVSVPTCPTVAPSAPN